MGFQTGLSGLNAASKNLDVIGHNVANSATVGFKSSQAQFADVFAASLSGGGASQVGIGTKLANVAQQFTQGNITSTNNPLDMAINGRGFFQLSQNGAVTYSRNGQFQLDKNNFIVANGGQRLQGYAVDPITGLVSGTVGDLSISSANTPPVATGKNDAGAAVIGAVVGANLNANAIKLDTTVVPPVPSTAAHDPWTLATPPVLPPSGADPATYSSTSANVYDSLGNSHVLTMYFHHLDPSTAANTWEVYTMIDGDPALTATGNPVTLGFTPAGEIDPAVVTKPTDYTFTLANGALSTLDFSIDYSTMTQYGSAFGVNELSVSGQSSGRLAGFAIGDDGSILGRYTNGQSKPLGQVVLANFANPQGLQQIGDNQWVESPNSGQALIGAPGTASLGLLQSSATEDSNVDLTAELVNMIVAQRAYQANAQTIKTQDAIQQTLMNLR